MIGVIVIIYLISWIICGVALYLSDNSTSWATVIVFDPKNRIIFQIVLCIGGFIPVVNTLLAIWLLWQTEIE